MKLDLSSLTNDPSPLVKRAEELFRLGKVYGLRQQGNTFLSRVEGKSQDSYPVSLYIDDNGRMDGYSCSCEASRRYPGPCKHVVATLLAIKEKYGGSDLSDDDSGFYSDIDYSDLF